jgi:ABC-type antimicrobial peptide transport system permease subunit
MDVLLAFPQLILALAVASILGPAVQNVVIADRDPIIPRARAWCGRPRCR